MNQLLPLVPIGLQTEIIGQRGVQPSARLKPQEQLPLQPRRRFRRGNGWKCTVKTHESGKALNFAFLGSVLSLKTENTVYTK